MTHQGWNGQDPQQGWQQPGGVPQFARLAIRQKIAMTVNRYEVMALDDAGHPGQPLATAQQKRLAFKEQVTFFADESRTRPVFSFRARQVVDLAATYDVVDGFGQPLGWFKKEFGKSFMRSTWSAQDAYGRQFVGTERSLWVAVLRRLMEDSWWLNSFYHFDFTTSDGQPVLHHSRTGGFRDAYAVDLPVFGHGERLDWRFAAALGVALDALQGR